MITEIIFAGFMMASHQPSCYVQGLVYGTVTDSEADALLVMPTECPITYVRYERLIVLRSPSWVVEIVIPKTGGWLILHYLWGHEEVSIGTKQHLVTYYPRKFTLYESP